MTDSHPLLDEFLARLGWGHAIRTPMPADWSTRRYTRLSRGDERAILMQTKPDEAFTAFVRVDGVLRRLQLSAPRIFGADAALGLMLLEDFGDRNFGRMIDAGADPAPLLRRGAAILADIHARFAPTAEEKATLPRFDMANFLGLLAPVTDQLIPRLSGSTLSATARDDFFALWETALAPALTLPSSLMLRDYMADNLMDLPDRDGLQATGLLDFELTGLGPIAYDLASLCEQVRRDLTPALRDDIINDYLSLRPMVDAVALRRGITLLAAQRHMRIVAVAHGAGKNAFAARAWRYLSALLEQDAALTRLRPWLDRHLAAAITGLAA